MQFKNYKYNLKLNIGYIYTYKLITQTTNHSELV